jgi:hypothetical protein
LDARENAECQLLYSIKALDSKKKGGPDAGPPFGYCKDQRIVTALEPVAAYPPGKSYRRREAAGK